MHPQAPENTSATLLGRLRAPDGDGTAWQEFVARYQPRIYGHCLACSLQPADAEDVTQAVLLRLVQKMPEFRYDPTQRFRAWLRTVTQRILLDFLAERRCRPAGDDSAIVRVLDNLEAREGLAQQVEAEFDRELLDTALKRVRPRVPEQQWNAFRLTALDGLSGAEAANRLDMPVATVYTAKSKVQKLVREEVRRLEDASEAV